MVGPLFESQVHARWILGPTVGAQSVQVVVYNLRTNAQLASAIGSATAVAKNEQLTSTFFTGAQATPSVPYDVSFNVRYVLIDQFGQSRSVGAVGATAVWSDPAQDPPQSGDPQCTVSGTVLTCQSAIVSRPSGTVNGFYILTPTPPPIPAALATSGLTYELTTSDEPEPSPTSARTGRVATAGSSRLERRP